MHKENYTPLYFLFFLWDAGPHCFLTSSISPSPCLSDLSPPMNHLCGNKNMKQCWFKNTSPPASYLRGQPKPPSCGSAAAQGCQKVRGKIHPLPTQPLQTARDPIPNLAYTSLITGKRREKYECQTVSGLTTFHYCCSSFLAEVFWYQWYERGKFKENLNWAHQQQPHSFSLWSL